MRRDLLHAPDPERHRHPLFRAHRIDQDRDVVSFGLLEQQCRSACLHNPVGDFGDLKDRADRRADPLELLTFVQDIDEIL